MSLKIYDQESVGYGVPYDEFISEALYDKIPSLLYVQNELGAQRRVVGVYMGDIIPQVNLFSEQALFARRIALTIERKDYYEFMGKHPGLTCYRFSMQLREDLDSLAALLPKEMGLVEPMPGYPLQGAVHAAAGVGIEAIRKYMRKVEYGRYMTQSVALAEGYTGARDITINTANH